VPGEREELHLGGYAYVSNSPQIKIKYVSEKVAVMSGREGTPERFGGEKEEKETKILSIQKRGKGTLDTSVKKKKKTCQRE